MKHCICYIELYLTSDMLEGYYNYIQQLCLDHQHVRDVRANLTCAQK